MVAVMEVVVVEIRCQQTGAEEAEEAERLGEPTTLAGGKEEPCLCVPGPPGNEILDFRKEEGNRIRKRDVAPLQHCHAESPHPPIITEF